MPVSLQIVFHQLDPWPGAEALLRERAQKLERFCPDLLSCRVVVEETQKHHQLGRPVAVRVEARLPGYDLSVNRQHDTDFKVAAREAFEAMTRRLEDVGRRRREQGMAHGAHRAGQVLVAQEERQDREERAQLELTPEALDEAAELVPEAVPGPQQLTEPVRP